MPDPTTARPSESTTDSFGTTFTFRMQEGWTHVQLLIRHPDGEPYSYGFLPEDFKSFLKAGMRLDERISA